MKRELQNFKDFLNEAVDPGYYQDTFYFTVLISMDKERGGSRDETKNDIRALPEVLTVTLVEKEKGGVQRDLGNSYMSTLKLHIRRPRDISKAMMMKRLVKQVARLKGVSVLRYKERKPKPRKKAFHGPGSYKLSEADYQKSPARKKRLRVGFKRLTQTGPNDSGPYKALKQDPSWKSAPPGAPGGLEEAQLAEAMKTPADLPEGVVVVVLKEPDSSGFMVYYARADNPKRRLKAGDLERMESGLDIYGTLRVSEGRNEPYEGVYIVTSAKAKDGFGPLLYDVALEVAGANGLKPDTLDVSDDASAVWEYYDTQRDDVGSKMLVLDTDDFELVMPEERAEDPGTNEHLAQVYFKKGKKTTQELIDQNKLIELNPGLEASRTSPREELTDLAGELGIPIVGDKDLSRFDRLYEDVVVSIGGDSEEDLLAFDIQPELNPKLWNEDEEVRPGIKGALIDIIEEFMEGLDLDLDIKDLIVTGSIANYNWSKFSDIDLHILLDFAEINDDKEMVKKFFDAVRSNWNKLHNITVKGHEVEIYVQDEKEPHISTGVYSLDQDRWLVKPKKIRPQIDRHTALKKMRHLSREIEKLSLIHDRQDYDKSFALAERLKEKIKKMRQSGLESTGIYSPENLAFKMLRRSGDIEQLFAVFTDAYDKLHSVEQ